MPYARCLECGRVLVRPGGRGSRIGDFCCPVDGGALVNAQTPALERGERARTGRVVLRWVYDERKDDPGWRAAMTGSL
jgi:hypothetical protein